MFVFSLFTSNNATSLGEAQIGQHIKPCNIMLHFVTVYNLLSVVILWSQVTALTVVSLLVIDSQQ